MKLKLFQLNIEQIQDEQNWLIEKLLVALAKERRSETLELYNKSQTIEKLIECLRREFYPQPAFIPADIPEKEKRKIKDCMWQKWRNHRFQTWQQMIDEALKDCNPKEIIKKRKLVEQWLKASEEKPAKELSGQKPKETAKPEAKPIVTFSNDFLTVNCATWKKSESRKRARQANTILRELYKNYKRGNKPIPVEKMLKGISTERIDKLLNKTRYPQTFNIICQRTDEQTGKRTISLSDGYDYRE